MNKIISWLTVLVLALFGAGAWAQPVILNYGPFAGMTSTTALTLGADGNIWFADRTNNAIGVMTSAGAYIAEYTIPTANGATGQMTLGPDNNVWFTEWNNNKVAKITTAGVITEYSVSGSQPAGIVSGPDGNMWVAFQAPGSLYNLAKIVPSTGAATYLNTSDVGEVGVTVGKDGNIWTTGNWTNAYASVNPSTDAVSAFTSYTSPNGSHWGLAELVGDSVGNVWLNDFNGYLVQVPIATPSAYTGITTPNGEGSTALTLAPNGNVWFLTATSINVFTPTLNTLTTAQITSYSTGIASAANNSFISNGANNTIWFGEQNMYFGTLGFVVSAQTDGTPGATVTPTSQNSLLNTSTNQGPPVSVTVTPPSGYLIASVTGDTCTPTLTSGSAAVTSVYSSGSLTSSCTITAHFTNTFTIVGAASPTAGGTVACPSGNLSYPSTVDCSVTTNPGYTLASVSDNCGAGGASGGSGTSFYQVAPVEPSCKVTATYTLNSYTVTATANPSAGGTVSCPATINYGGSGSCTATPINNSYSFTGFSGSCTGMTCTLSNVQSNQMVLANFAPVILTSSCIASPVSAPAGTSVTVTCSNVPSGSTVTIAGLTCGAVSGGQAVCTGTSGTGTGQIAGNMSASITASGFTPAQALTVLFSLLPAGVASIPTLGEYALAALMLILAGFGALQIRRRY